MIEISKDIIHAGSFLQSTFTIILALALGEAFKQFVADSDDRPIHWDRTPALLFFLFLIFPFFHGMSRYFFVTYINASHVTKSYSGYLLFDGLAFLGEAALFFVMSRALKPNHWQRLSWSVLILLAIDSVWCAVALEHGTSTLVWLVLNGVLAAVLLALLAVFKNDTTCMRASILGAAAAGITTALSYYFFWNFYFP